MAVDQFVVWDFHSVVLRQRIVYTCETLLAVTILYQTTQHAQLQICFTVHKGRMATRPFKVRLPVCPENNQMKWSIASKLLLIVACCIIFYLWSICSYFILAELREYTVLTACHVMSFQMWNKKLGLMTNQIEIAEPLAYLRRSAVRQFHIPVDGIHIVNS